MSYNIKYDELSHRLKLEGIELNNLVTQLKAPLSVILQITRNCHFNCEFCSEKDSMLDPTLDELKKYAEHLKNVPRVFLSGGEPLTRSDFKEVVDIFKEGHILGLPTNAIASEKNLEIIKANHISVNVGLDGPRAITSRVRGDYDFIMRGVKGFIKNDIPFSFTAVVLRSTMDSVLYTCQMADALGARKMKFVLPIPKGNKLISESVRLNIETQRYNFMSESKHEIYSCRVFGITELMDAFERITNKLKCSCEKTIPKVENDLWYRGQMNGQYELLPSIMRPNLTERTQFGYLAQYQRYLFEKFKYRADGTPEIMDSSQFTISDYLALMQHYQVKTNLMDWSEDAFTGIYFALEKFITGEIKEIVNSPSIQIFSPGLYNRARKQMIDLGVTDLSENQKAFKASLKTTGGRSGEIPNIATGYNEEIYNMFLLGNRKYETEDCYGYKEEIKISGGKELAFLPLAIYTSRLNPRMRTQSGMFLAYNLYTEPSLKNEYGYMSLEKIQEYYMNECKAENKQQFLYKIMIDKKSVKEIADCFIALGLSTEKIYPELSNIGSKIR